MKLMDTIAAVSTPYGKGGVALIRISGADAIAIGEKVFFPASGKQLGELAHGSMTYGEIRRPNGEDLDDGMAVCFYAPRSFTGENTVEITCHGGVPSPNRCWVPSLQRAQELQTRENSPDGHIFSEK